MGSRILAAAMSTCHHFWFHFRATTGDPRRLLSVILDISERSHDNTVDYMPLDLMVGGNI
jgi:hypothetical protein